MGIRATADQRGLTGADRRPVTVSVRVGLLIPRRFTQTILRRSNGRFSPESTEIRTPTVLPGGTVYGGVAAFDATPVPVNSVVVQRQDVVSDSIVRDSRVSFRRITIRDTTSPGFTESFPKSQVASRGVVIPIPMGTGAAIGADEGAPLTDWQIDSGIAGRQRRRECRILKVRMILP